MVVCAPEWLATLTRESLRYCTRRVVCEFPERPNLSLLNTEKEQAKEIKWSMSTISASTRSHFALSEPGTGNPRRFTPQCNHLSNIGATSQCSKRDMHEII